MWKGTGRAEQILHPMWRPACGRSRYDEAGPGDACRSPARSSAAPSQCYRLCAGRPTRRDTARTRRSRTVALHTLASWVDCRRRIRRPVPRVGRRLAVGHHVAPPERPGDPQRADGRRLGQLGRGTVEHAGGRSRSADGCSRCSDERLGWILGRAGQRHHWHWHRICCGQPCDAGEHRAALPW